jgi:hypothetical protein
MSHVDQAGTVAMHDLAQHARRYPGRDNGLSLSCSVANLDKDKNALETRQLTARRVDDNSPEQATHQLLS